MNDQAVQDAATKALTQAAKEAGEQAATGFFEKIFTAYNSFIDRFPEPYQWIVSLAIGIFVVHFLWQLIKRNWLWIVLAIVLFPGILPVIKNFFDSLTIAIIGKRLD